MAASESSKFHQIAEALVGAGRTVAPKLQSELSRRASAIGLAAGLYGNYVCFKNGVSVEGDAA